MLNKIERDRFICTKETPWNESIKGPVTHPDAEYLGDRDFGGGEYCERYRCPHCNKSFYVELPQ